MSVGCKRTELIASKRTQFTLLGRNDPEANVRFGSKADVRSAKQHVRCTSRCLLRASGHRAAYSITSSALVSSDGGIVSPSALAVLRLSTNSNLVDRMTGRSAGLSPLRIRPA